MWPQWICRSIYQKWQILRSWGWDLTIHARQFLWVCGWTNAWRGLMTSIFWILESSATMIQRCRLNSTLFFHHPIYSLWEFWVILQRNASIQKHFNILQTCSIADIYWTKVWSVDLGENGLKTVPDCRASAPMPVCSERAHSLLDWQWARACITRTVTRCWSACFSPCLSFFIL
jgi:hypothetical protein